MAELPKKDMYLWHVRLFLCPAAVQRENGGRGRWL